MNYKESLEKLFSLHQFGIKLGLDNIRKLLTHIGNPERELKAIHIAGSNGKGSTASFIASILIEAGFKVGLYTSPHFVRYNERIRINGVEISDDYVVEFINKNIDYIEQESPTFFELTTALAFLYFAEKKVDYAVIETGLGGRLDATNVLDSMGSIITSISYEHTNILGNDLTSIAKEKAEIIKKNQNVFIGKMPDTAKDVIIAKAKMSNSEFYEVEKFTELGDEKSIIPNKEKAIEISNLPLLGSYQITNASLAVLTIINLFPNIETNIITKGLKKVVVNSGIRGRYEIYHQTPRVIFDAAHNYEGVELFLKAFQKEKNKYAKSILIYGAMRDKNVGDIIKKLSRYFDDIYGTEINYERSLKINELVKIGEKNEVEVIPLESPSKFVDNFIQDKNNSGDVLVILGSIYILGEIKTQLLAYNT